MSIVICGHVRTYCYVGRSKKMSRFDVFLRFYVLSLSTVVCDVNAIVVNDAIKGGM